MTRYVEINPMVTISVRLREQKMDYINQKRLSKGWKKFDEQWAKNAFVSMSTLKRFWRGAISIEYFMNICRAISIDDWEHVGEYVQKDKDTYRPVSFKNTEEISNVTSIPTSQPELELGTNKFIITIRYVGVLNEDEIIRVNHNLEELKTFFSEPFFHFQQAKKIISQLATPKANYFISFNGVATLSDGKPFIVNAILNELKDYFKEASFLNVTMKPALEINSMVSQVEINQVQAS